MKAKSVPSAEDDLASIDRLWKQHSYISDFIKFADAKAAFLATFAAGIAANFIGESSKLRPLLAPMWFRPAMLEQCLGLVAVSALWLSMIFCLFVVFPRLKASGKEGIISWVEIARFDGPDSFAVAATATRSESVSKLLAKQIYYLSVICLRKNQLVRCGMFSLGGAMFSILLCEIIK